MKIFCFQIVKKCVLLTKLLTFFVLKKGCLIFSILLSGTYTPAKISEVLYFFHMYQCKVQTCSALIFSHHSIFYYIFYMKKIHILFAQAIWLHSWNRRDWFWTSITSSCFDLQKNLLFIKIMQFLMLFLQNHNIF